MPAPLRCPTCSGPLDIPPEHATTTRCTYCGAGVLLTERGGQAQAASERHTGGIAEALAHLRAGDRLAAIKAYREHFGVGLAEARYAVERLEAGQSAGWNPAQPAFVASAPAAPEEVLRQLRAGNKIAAVKAYRDQTGVGLAEAVAAVDRIAAAQPPGSLPSPPGTRGCMMIFGAALAVLGIATFIYFGQRDAAPRTVAAEPTPVERLAPAPPAAEKAGPPAFAEPVSRFGSQGTGAGRFEDARSVAVDGAGRIYVAEYSGGRVQVFDSAGTFLTQWMADTRMPLLDLEADRGGTVYVVQSGRIRRYEGATGRALEEVRRPRGASFNDVAVALDGTLWAVSDNNDQVLHLNADGRVLRTIDAHEAIDEDASPARVAVAGTGDLYLTDTWTGVIYHLGPDGRFRNRFGGRGTGPGTMSAPQDLVVDGRGRVYASDMMGGVHVFDPDGRFLSEFATAGIFGIAFNDRDELFASHRNDAEIVKYRLNQ